MFQPKLFSLMNVGEGAMTLDFMKSGVIVPSMHPPNWRVFVETSDFVRLWVDFTWNPPISCGFHVKSKDHLQGIVNPMFKVFVFNHAFVSFTTDKEIIFYNSRWHSTNKEFLKLRKETQIRLSDFWIQILVYLWNLLNWTMNTQGNNDTYCFIPENCEVNDACSSCK